MGENVRNVLEWLEVSEVRVPDKIAVAGPDDSLTFGQLAREARSVGTWLATEGGMAPRTSVALFLEKSPRALACMLGAVYAGGFYTVIDVRQPPERVRSICADLEPCVVVTDGRWERQAVSALAGTPYRVVRMEALLGFAPDPATLERVRRQACDTDPLYVNFTSGSTGTPKGVVVSHRSVVDFIPIFDRIFGMGEEDVFANQAPFDFDVSVKDIYSCLYLGATLRLVPREYFSQPARLMDYLCDSQVTTLVWAVSAMTFVSIMGGLEYRVPTTVRRVLFSGEVMPPKQLAKWQRYLPAALYVNLYGPTEVTCNCTYYVVDRPFEKGERIPMGRAFPNERVMLVDAMGNEVRQPGEQGEVCVSGTALALGYLGDAERTAKAFVQSPLNGRWIEPLYHTGDLACYDREGNLVYCSRLDHQIKLNGQRIELGDIESTACGIEGVEQACCLYDARRRRLRLYYVGGTEHDEVTRALEGLLPPYMMPNATKRLDMLPLTKNGKVDRGALEEMR